MASPSTMHLAGNSSVEDILLNDIRCDAIPGCSDTVASTPPTNSILGVVATSTQDTTSYSLSSLSPSVFPSSTTETSTIPLSTSSVNTSRAQSPPDPILPTITPASGKTSAGTTRTSPTFTSSSSSASASTSETEMTSNASANRPTTSSSLQSSSNPPSPLQPQVPTVTSSSPSHRVSRIPTPALAGAIASVTLATATAILLSFWLRRRRARARASLSPQNSTLRSFTRDNSAAATAPIVRPLSNVSSKAQANNSGSVTRTHTHSLVSESSHGARFGSATNQEPPTSSRTFPPIHADHKDCEFQGQSGERRSFSRPLPDLPSTEYISDRSESLSGMLAMSQDNATAAPELATAGTQDERHLHLALPWAFGQRVLAMMAGEDRDAQSVRSESSEPLPAYEPRR